MPYIGRFAPSPSGPLHFGSLIAALGSYLQAKSQAGHWGVRIEDIDPPREIDGAADLILQALEAYHLHWDGEVQYQSQRSQTYQAQIDQWLSSGQAYYCQCTRSQIKQAGGYYLGRCRDKQLNTTQRDNNSAYAVRLRVDQPIYQFIDQKQGPLSIPRPLAEEDFIIKRRDGLFAYNLAVVLDDIEQGVTEVVRGADLIEPTGRQISLYHALGAHPPSYLHLPLAVDTKGNKLSKQNRATAIDIQNPKPTLIQAMACLGLRLPARLAHENIANIIHWGTENWSLAQLSTKNKIISPFSNGAR